MAIRFSKYVDITSGVAGTAAVRLRDLIGRLFTQSPLLGAGDVVEMDDAGDVAAFFGDQSPEHLRALLYFSYVTPSLSGPRLISFARYAPTGDTTKIYGDRNATANLATLAAISAGALSFEFENNATVVVSGIDLTGSASLAAVASTIQTALNANADVNLDNATVTYDATRGAFIFSNALASPGTVSIAASSALSTALGWSSPNTRFVDGIAAQSPVTAVTASVDVSDNFGSFAFVGDLADLTAYSQVAAFVAGQNIRYMFMVPVRSMLDAADYAAGLGSFAGVAVTFSPLVGEFPELIPMAIEAATDYSKRNAVVNYMFRQIGGITASVNDDATSDQLDALRVNYYGRTQTAGQVIQFYQRGLLMGTPTDPSDMNVYANEQWLKDRCAAQLMALLLGTNRVPANASGRGMILATVQDSIDAAIYNGVISVGKELTTPQKLFITTQTGDELAWHQVNNVGYWIDAVIQLDETVAPAQYKAVYTLIYSKDDAIRKVEGTHFLI